MKRAARAALAAGCTAAAVLALGAASRYGVSLDERGTAVVRLSWRVRSVRVRECRKLTAQELAALPAHMREAESCEGRLAPYRLRVVLDGREVESSLVTGSGARQDRPLYVYRDLDVAPGRHTVAIDFWRQGGEHQDEEETAAAAPARLGLRAVLPLEPDDIVLVTYDGERRALVARGAAGDIETTHLGGESHP